MGATATELDLSAAKVNYPKTKFSMFVPEVEKELKGIKSVVLFGIEVKPNGSYIDGSIEDYKEAKPKLNLFSLLLVT